MSAALSWVLPLHAGLDDWHGWLYQIAAIASVGGVWVGLPGVAERFGERGRGGDQREVGDAGGSQRGAGFGPLGVQNPELRDEAH